jgi:hypothetical protein
VIKTESLTRKLRELVDVVEEQVRPVDPEAEPVVAGEAAAFWVISTVFVRFAEDNGLLAQLTPPGPADSATAWLHSRFEELVAADPGKALLDRQVSPLNRTTISEAAGRDLIGLWERDGGGRLIHSFATASLDTRFLGDLYQHLSDLARERYALVQTPQFVVDFLLDLTLTPAVREFGCDRVRLVDPVCGSGGFLLSAFDRLLHAWGEAAPTMPIEERIARALRGIHGVDLHPLAAAITRFRLLVAAIRASGASTLEAAAGSPWQFNIAVGDALLDDDLFEERFDVVVGNPPYTVVRDKDRDQRYRDRYDACEGRYPLTVPFAQRFFGLARPDGYVGQLVSNSFMRREFGRKLATEFLAQRVALTHIIDTSGAFIPGHGTPTSILIGRNRPADDTEPVFTVLGLRGEPELPDDPAHGLVWQSILRNSARAGRADEWTASRYLLRRQLRSFPWQLTTGEAADALDAICAAPTRLRDFVRRIGYLAITGADDIFTAPRATFARLGIPLDQPVIEVITGSEVRDWIAVPERWAYFPYDRERQVVPLASDPRQHYRLWPYRTLLGQRPTSGRSYHRPGRSWYEWHQLAGSLGTRPPAIVYAWVATHNHFAPLPDGVVPLPSAPVIELRPDTPAERRAELLAVLNSSTAGFWLRQVSQAKGKPDVEQTGSGEPWDDFLQITATRLYDLPLPDWHDLPYAAELDRLARELAATTPAAVLAIHPPGREFLAQARARWESIRARMLAIQEELDWEVYRRYGLVDDPGVVAPPGAIPPIDFGERAFEFVMARQLAAGVLQTSWFTRHGGAPVTEPPAHWPQSYLEVVLRRIRTIENHQRLAALERPEFKRRWSSPGWDAKLAAALREWLLDRCETAALWYEDRGGVRRPRPMTASQLAVLLGTDESAVTAAELYAPEQPLAGVIRELIADEHVPYLAALRYREAALTKRADWDRVWQQQRDEDQLRADGDAAAADKLRDNIPNPPKYTSADFLKPSYWRHRGKYDVPNERFISYPRPGGPTTDLLVGWAGWTPAERAQVLADLTMPGRSDPQAAVPLLAGLWEALPWVDQWSPGASAPYRAHLDTRLGQLDLTEQELVDWRPPPPKRGRPRKLA